MSASSPATERRARSGRSSQSATTAGEREQREAELEVEEAAAERRRAHQRHERAEVEGRAQRELRRREQHVDRRRDEREPAATTNAIDTRAQPRPAHARTSGRAISIRSTNSPIAAITERKTTQRAIERAAAWRRSPRSTGSRTAAPGPGFGPTANVNAPRTGWPSTEITRQ